MQHTKRLAFAVEMRSPTSGDEDDDQYGSEAQVETLSIPEGSIERVDVTAIDPVKVRERILGGLVALLIHS